MASPSKDAAANTTFKNSLGAPGPSGPITSAADLVASIEQQIATGALKAGDRLTPVRTLAGELGLAPNTAAAAYRTLRDRGLVFSDRRRGTFVAEGQAATAGEPVVPSGVVDLASGSPDPRLLPDLGSALASVASGYGGRLLAPDKHVTYGQAPIDEQLIAAFRPGLELDVSHCLNGALRPDETFAVVGGALDGIERALLANLRPGDQVAVEDPAYPSVLNLLAALNLRPVAVPVDAYGLMQPDLEGALAAGAKAVILTPRAQNPTGAALDRGRAGKIAEVLGRYPQALVVEDDYAGPVAGCEYNSAVPEGAVRWVVIRSVAKALGPDLRLAGMAGDPTTIGRVTSRQLVGTGWVSHILQRTAANLMTDAAATAQVELAAAEYRQRREGFIEALASANIEAFGRSGLNVWIPVSDEAEIVAGMQAEGFAIRSGSRFRRSSQPAVRVTTAATDLPVLTDAAAALTRLLAPTQRVRSA